jgi:hypothetical protein
LLACAVAVLPGSRDRLPRGDKFQLTATAGDQRICGGDEAGEPAWAARVFLLLGQDGLQQEYQLTVKPLAAE